MRIDFDAPHQEADPWGYERHWYEKRRRALIAAMLPCDQLGRVLEIGCSTGLITQLLAARAEQVLAVDISAKAIELAREKLRGVANVQLQHADITQQWPGPAFDQVLLCDVAYYLEAAQLRQLARNIRAHAPAHGVVLLAHWRHGFAQVVTPTEAAHQLFGAELGWHALARYADEDLWIDVWSRAAASVACQEGLA